MRDIKFRLWDKKDKCIIPNIHTCYDGNVKGYNKHVRWDSFPTEDVFKDEVVLMQFTGLKDKNGVEIYEGDIIRWRWKDGKDYDDHIIRFYNGSWTSIHIMDKSTSFNHQLIYEKNSNFTIEVIGNIYESKELLEK